MQITVLGSGTPTPSLQRMSSGYRLKIGDETIILDCGPGTYHRMMEAGSSVTDVSTILISHLHYDHCLDYQRFVLTHWDQSGSRPSDLKVHGPAPLERITRQLFSPDGVWGPDLTARTEHKMSLDIHAQRGGSLPRPWPSPQVSEIAAGRTIDCGAWTATPFEVRHAQPYLDCYGYRIRSDAGDLVYFGDTGPFDGLAEHAKGADVLISMCHYLSGTQLSETYATSCMGHCELAETAARAGVRNVVVTHITKQFDRPGIRERVVSDMAKIFGGNIFFSHDLMDIPIGNPNPMILD